MTDSVTDRRFIVSSHQLCVDRTASVMALLAAALLSAGAYLLAFPPLSFWPAIFFAPAALGWLALAAPNTRSAVGITFIVHLALWLWFGRWLAQVTTAGYPFYAMYLAVYPSLFVWIIRRAHSARPAASASSRCAWISSLPCAITIPVIWTGLEMLRGELAFNGYPWFLVAHPLIEAPELVQSADLLGMYFISFLAAMTAGGLLDVVRFRQRLLDARPILIIVGCIVIVHAANMAYGYWRIGQTDPLEPGPMMLAIQTNMPQDNKMRGTIEQRIEQSERFMLQTVAAVSELRNAGHHPDLIIWPETMVFGLGLEPETIELLSNRTGFPPDWTLAQIQAMRENDIPVSYYHLAIANATTLRMLSDEMEIPMLLGSPACLGLSFDDDGRPRCERNYNAAYLIDGQSPHERYDKHFLTPFGETMPYISNWPWLEERLLDLGARGMRFDLDAGTAFNRLALNFNDRTIHLATPICFEVTMSRTCRRLAGAGADERADVFINLSNDGWFGWYDAGRVQHAQIARFRCIEHRTPMVRSVNTGLSMTIDSTGRIVGVVGGGQYGDGRRDGALLAVVTLDSRQTLYTVLGNSFGWLTLLLTALALAASFGPRQGKSSP